MNLRNRIHRHAAHACTLLFCLVAASSANAGILSAGVCRPYRNLVDKELFVVLAAIGGAVLVIAWKTSGAGNKALQGGIGLIAALAVGLNIENILQMATGVGIFC